MAELGCPGPTAGLGRPVRMCYKWRPGNTSELAVVPRSDATKVSRMKNFARALRLSLRHRLTIIASIACALAVALLWGGNISVIYPVVEVVFKGQSLPEWVDEQIQNGEAATARLEREVSDLQS